MSNSRIVNMANLFSSEFRNKLKFVKHSGNGTEFKKIISNGISQATITLRHAYRNAAYLVSVECDDEEFKREIEEDLE